MVENPLFCLSLSDSLGCGLNELSCFSSTLQELTHCHVFHIVLSSCGLWGGFPFLGLFYFVCLFLGWNFSMVGLGEFHGFLYKIQLFNILKSR